MKQDMIVILDLGSHENTVLARAIRALGVYSEIYPHNITAEELKALPNVKGIIINGGPNNVIDGVAIDVNAEIYNAGFGQGILTTPIQNVKAMTPLTNDGMLLEPYLISKIVDSDTKEVTLENKRTEIERVASTGTVQKMIQLMDATVNEYEP